MMDTNEPLYVAIGIQIKLSPISNRPGNSETNSHRIAAVEKLFGFPANKLTSPKRVLVGEGVLTKVCRKKAKLRHLFLFNDILLYGRVLVHRKVLRNPQSIDLSDVAVDEVNDNGGYQNGFSILSPKKSFTVFASSAEEKVQWLAHLRRCIGEARLLAGTTKQELVKHSPVWIPDSEASHCMVCTVTEFGFLTRKHHCRRCGKVLCQKCSTHRWMLPYQGSDRVRVCNPCHERLKSNIERQTDQLTGDRTQTTISHASSMLEENSIMPIGGTTTFDCFRKSIYIEDTGMNDDLNTASDSESD